MQEKALWGIWGGGNVGRIFEAIGSRNKRHMCLGSYEREGTEAGERKGDLTAD